MRFLKNRNLMGCSLVFIIALYIFARVGTPIRIGMTCLAVILSVGCLFLLRTPTAFRIQAVFLCACFFLATAVGFYAFSVKDGSLRDGIGSRREMTLTVNEVKTSLPYLSEFYVEGKGYKALLTCEYPLDAKAGDRVSGELHILDFEDDINGYPEKEYQFSKGNAAHLYSYEDNLTLEEGGLTASAFFANIREGLVCDLSSVLSEEHAAYYSCLLLGEKEGLPSFVTRDFRDLGISHLLAISGMHLGILTGALMLILRLFYVHRSARNIISIVAVVLFAVLTGFPSSLTRAAVATVIVLCCYFIKKRPDGATAVTLAVSLIYLFDPHAVFDIGLTLSFMAALGIVTVTPLFIKKASEWRMPSFAKKIIDGILVTVIALTFTMPFSMYYFGTFSFLSLFTTLLFAPFVSAALYTAPFILLLGKVPYLGTALCFIAEKLAQLTFDLSSFLAERLQFTLSVAYPFARILFLLFCIGFTLLLIFAPKRPWPYLIPLFAFTVCLYSGAAIYRGVNADKVYLSINETKRNDTICLTSRGKTTILDISGATSSPASAALYAAKNEQYAVYIENYVIVNRTYRTLSFVIRSTGANRINNLYLPKDVLSEDEIADITINASKHGTQVHLYSFGDTVDLDGISITPSEPSYIKRSKMPIHSIMINAGENTVHYVGAAYSELELDCIEADLTVAGSYGPLYKEDFSFEGEVLYSKSAADYYTGEGTVYEKVTNVILNND